MSRKRDRSDGRERGAALVLALFVVIILSTLGLGLLMRAQLSQASAGAERTMTKNFYAADAGIGAGFAHLQVNNPCPMSFSMLDLRAGARYPIAVTVEEASQVGPPQLAPGSGVGGGISGGGTSLVFYTWRQRADARETATQTYRQVEADVAVGPTTLAIIPPCQ